MGNREIRALIFDFDGLIVETEGPIYQSWQELYQAHDQDLPFSLWSQIIGTYENPWHPLSELEQRLARPVDEALLAARLQRETELIARQKAMPGVEALLEAARGAGLKIGLASSSDREWVETHLTRLGLLHYFDCLRTKDDVRRTKPDPELYLSALACLEVAPEQALVLEDSPMGVLAAHSAGIFAVAVPNDLTRVLPFEHANLRLETLEGVSLDDLLARAGRNGGSPPRPAA